MAATVKESVRKVRIRISAPQSGQQVSSDVGLEVVVDVLTAGRQVGGVALRNRHITEGPPRPHTVEMATSPPPLPKSRPTEGVPPVPKVFDAALRASP
jgi:hypothetical protein